jgi:hypothetical protein
MRWLAAVMVLGACTPPQLEIDVVADPDGLQLFYRGAQCECQPRYPQQGECWVDYLDDVAGDSECTCAESCLEDVRVVGRTFVVEGCGGEAHGEVPSLFAGPPRAVTVSREVDHTLVAVTVDAPASTFFYAYSCDDNFLLPASTCQSFTATQQIQVCPDAGPVQLRSQQLVDTFDSELGIVRVWAGQSTIYVP